ncbi:patatin-like phospholipase family protein [Serratia ureilytica]
MKAAKGFKSIYFIGANLNSGQREVYSHRTTPRMKVADGLRISMSFPFAFVAKKNALGDLCIDGGMIDNYPVRLFDYDFSATPPYIDSTSQRINTRTLGIRLTPPVKSLRPPVRPARARRSTTCLISPWRWPT